MDKDQVLALLREDDRENISPRTLELARDFALAQLLEFAAIDHVRLVRLEKLSEFMLSRQVIEVPRRPSTAEAKAFTDAGLPVPAQLVTKRTLLDEFDITYAEFFQQFMKPKVEETPADRIAQLPVEIRSGEGGFIMPDLDSAKAFADRLLKKGAGHAQEA